MKNSFLEFFKKIFNLINWLQEYGLDDIFQFEHNDDMDVLFIDEQRNNADEISLNEENMPAVTIFKNNQLGISINVEEHEEIDNNSSESRDTSKDSRVFENPFKKLERLASRSSLKHNENDKNWGFEYGTSPNIMNNNATINDDKAVSS